jgi:Ca-activated chloride channel homolog
LTADQPGTRLAISVREEEVVKRLALTFGLLFAAVAGVPAQQPEAAAPPAPTQPPQSQSPQPLSVFRSGASLVALNVTVTDGSKRFVRGLRAEDFAVFEDGVQQQLRFFEAGDVPIDLILLIDTSSSMRDKMSIVHEAALGFLKTLRDGDRGAVVSFNDHVAIAQALTTDNAALEAAVKSTIAHGATALHNALYISLKEFGRSTQHGLDVRRQAIAVLSDGEDTSSLVSFDDVLKVARATGVSIYAIRVQSEFATVRANLDPNRRQFSESTYAMKTLAQETGGQAYFPEDITDLKNVYAGIAQELSTQYSLGYTPSNGRRDGRLRRIIVQLPLQPTLRPRARSGYTADADRAAARK